MSVDHEDVLDAIAACPLADHDGLEVVEQWLSIQPANAGHMVISTSGDLKRVTLYSAGPPQTFAPIVGAFLAEGGASETELTQLASAGEGLEASQVGSWIELAHDGLDAGWYFPVGMPVTKGLKFAPANAVNDALAAWARKCGAHNCAQIRRSVDPDSPAAEIAIIIPGNDPAHELALVQQGFKSVGAPWFGDAMANAVKSAGSMELLLTMTIGQSGLNAAGVLMPEPSAAILETAYAAATRTDLGASDDFEATLNVDGPGMLGLYQYPWGMGIERFYPLG